MSEEQALENLEKTREHLIESAKRATEESRRRAEDHRRQLGQQNDILDAQRKEAETIRSSEIRACDEQIKSQQQRRSDLNDKAEAERLRQAEGHAKREDDMRQEHKGYVDRRVIEDDKEAATAKDARDQNERIAKEERDKINEDHLRQVGIHSNAIAYQRDLNKQEYDRKVDDKNALVQTNKNEVASLVNDLRAQTAQNRIERSAQLEAVIRQRLGHIEIAKTSSEVNAHDFTYRNSIESCAHQVDECINSCNTVVDEASALTMVLTKANQSKSLTAKIKFWNPDTSASEVKTASNKVKNACKRALDSVNSLQSVTKTASGTLYNSGTGVTDDIRKKYLEYTKNISNSGYALREHVTKISQYTEHRMSVEEFKEKIKELTSELDNLRNINRPMKENDTRLIVAMKSQQNYLLETTTEATKRNTGYQKAYLEGNSQQQQQQGVEDVPNEREGEVVAVDERI